jgi:transcription elongation factor Elf1
MNKQIRDEKNNALKKGIICPLCGKQLIDLKHCGVNNPHENQHEYWCDNCKITIRIHVDK